MKKTIQSPVLLICLFLCTFLLSSFSVEYAKTDSRDDSPPVSQKESRRNKRLKKRQLRLEKQLEKSNSAVRRQKIQKKLRHIDLQKDDGFGTPVIGIIGMILSIIGFICFIAFIGTLFYALSFGIATGFSSIALLIGGMGTALLGLVTSIVALVLNKKNPEKFTKKGFGLAGMIIGSVALGILIIATAIFFLFK